MDKLQFKGKAFQIKPLENGIAEVCFDLQGESVNKFCRLALEELKEVVQKLKSETALKGVLFTSAKDCFIVGADITEFIEAFKLPDSALETWLVGVNRTFSDIEDLPFPTVCAINGLALGGGMEMVLSCSYRVINAQTKIGVPETKLGIYPGWGGTVRLSRLWGADNAIEWIATG